METATNQTSEQNNDTFGSPFKQLPLILQKHIDLSPTSSGRGTAYVLERVRTVFPGPLGTCGHAKKMPEVGKGLQDPEFVLQY